MTAEPVLHKVADGVATVTLNRPALRNAFDAAMHARLAEALDAVAAEKSVRAMVLTGAGEGFCAGQDLNERRRKEGAPPPDLGRSLAEKYNPLIRRLVRFPVPTIAAVNGVAAGAGCGLALACDLVFAARSAKFAFAFARIGLIPDSGLTFFLPRLVGRARALGIALTGEAVGAEEAQRIGLIWKAVDDEILMDEALALARRLASGPALGLKRIKEAMARSGENALDAQLDLESETQRELGASEDYAEATKAFFEKRPPVFKGR
jgi:2-(1,2-epoxy-1,2-dihydrophenyl)acetyl-CoA isomerase